MAGPGDTETAAVRRLREESRNTALITIWALSVAALVAFRFAIRGQLAKLYPPQTTPYKFAALEGHNIAKAWSTWTDGRIALRSFTPAGADTLIRVHVGVELAILVLLIIGAAVLARCATWPVVVYVALGLLFVAALASGLMQLSLAAGPHTDRYAAAFDAIRWFERIVGSAVAILVIVLNREHLIAAFHACRRSPATARIASLAALGFAAVLQMGAIGAQAEDILHREIHQEYWYFRLTWILLALALYLWVVACTRHLELERGAPTRPMRLLLLGSIVMTVGLGIVFLLQGGSGPLAIGLLFVLIGLGSAAASGWSGDKGRGVPRNWMRFTNVVGKVALLLGSLLWAILRTPWPVALVAIGIGLVALATTASIERYRDESDDDPPVENDNSGRWLYAVAAAAAPAGLAMLTGRLLASQIATQHGWWPLATLEIMFLATAATGAVWMVRKGNPAPSPAAVTAAPRDGGTLKTYARAVHTRAQGIRWWRTATLAVVASVGPVFAIVAWQSPGTTTSFGNFLGSIDVLLLALASVVALGGLTRIAGAHDDAPAFFRSLGFQRTPVVLILLVWFVLVAVVGPFVESDAGSPHVARMLDRSGSAPSCSDTNRTTFFSNTPEAHTQIADELCAWITTRAAAAPDTPDRAVPLILVSASGGGVRAAAWTSRVLDCLLLPRDPAIPEAADPCETQHRTESEVQSAWDNVFAAGGASGGSVGIVSTTVEQLAPLTVDASKHGTDEWIRQLAGPDHVAPTILQMALAETAVAPAGVLQPRDRAEVLIDDWTAPFAKQWTKASASVTKQCPNLTDDLAHTGFLTAHLTCPQHVPLLLLNGTIVGEGRRFDISPLAQGDQRPHSASVHAITGTVKLRDVLCDDRDIPLMDAGFLSGRFPFVTPSAHFPAATTSTAKACGRFDPSAVEVVDGGYLENDGTSQILELWRTLGPLVHAYRSSTRHPGFRDIQPLLLNIENGEHTGVVRALPTPPRDGRCWTHSAPFDPSPDRIVRRGTTNPLTSRSQSDVGEPLRPVVAEAQVLTHDGSQGTQSTEELERELADDCVPIVRMALYEHPGRRLPLGWTLSNSILDDIDHVFQLEANTKCADQFKRLVTGTKAEQDRAVHERCVGMPHPHGG